jgi:hypothetical protein
MRMIFTVAGLLLNFNGSICFQGVIPVMNRLTVLSCIGLLTFVSANAQETPKFTFDIGGGFTNPAGNTSRFLNNGWNVGGGFGVNIAPWLGAKVNVSYNYMGINSGTLFTLGQPGGDVQVLSATLDPVVHLTPKRHVDLYVTGGGGLFHIYQEFTQPTVSVANVYNPFFGIYPVAFPTTSVLSSYSVNKPGFDVGAGMAFGAWGHGKIFAEAKWDHAFLTNSHVDFIPVSFGFRW